MQIEDKQYLVEQLVMQLKREAATLGDAARSTREGATHDEAKPENDKDTRAIEASYLAGAQAERARELHEAVAALEAMQVRIFGEEDPIAASALVTADTRGQESLFFIAPAGGGLNAEFEGVRVQVTTTRSPLGRALLGKIAGDVAQVEAGGGRREYEIVAVR